MEEWVKNVIYIYTVKYFEDIKIKPCHVLQYGYNWRAQEDKILHGVIYMWKLKC